MPSLVASRPRMLAAALLVTAACWSSAAAADDVAAAKALFNRGLADMESGQYDTGCPAISASYKLDPRPGTLFTLAECEAKRGRVATALARYEDYLAAFGRMTADQQKKQSGREAIAAAQKVALAPLVPELTITLPAAAPRGTVVKRDDVTLEEAALGVPLPIDPGEHVVTSQAPNGPVSELRVTLAKGEKKEVVLPVGTAAEGQPAKTETKPETPKLVTTALASVGPVAPPAVVVAGDGGGQRTAAFVVGGVGVAGVALGAVMGGLLFSKTGTVSANCADTTPGNAVCNPTGKEAAEAGKTFGLVSTIGFAAGLAALGGAVVIFATAPAKQPRTAAWVSGVVVSAGPEGASARIRGAF